MFDLIPLLSTVLPIIAASLLLIVILVNIYFKIRRKFPISVNCWFCNSWTKVPYDDRNSFDCPTCSQYNGFTKDGDYNKIIPEQHDELMNKSTRINRKSTVLNGLCVLCNNNQQLKIFQLANFVPLVEENYDVEIEHFQTQLEKAYKLCKKCDRVLKTTIGKQNAWIFGNRIKNMCSNGISKIAEQIKKENKTSLFTLFDGVLSTLLISAVILTIMSNINFFTKNIPAYIPEAYLPIYHNLNFALNSSKIVHLSVPPYFSKNIRIESYSVFCGIGLISRMIKVVGSKSNITSTIVNTLLCWVILFLISWVRFSRRFSSYVLFIEAFCCVYILATAFAKPAKPQRPKPSKSMRKVVKNLEYTCTDFSDISDFENISSSSKNSSGTSNYLNTTLDAPHTFNTAESILNPSFVSARSTVTNCVDLNKSLNNLHLGFKSPKYASSCASFAMKRPKPVLSPPKFQNVNSWVAGGFWRDADGAVMPVAQRTNLSRSSSESSGFGSQHNEFVAPKNYFTEFDKFSMNSEFSRLSPTPVFTFPQEKKTFYPNLQQNNMLLIQKVASPSLIKFNEAYQRGGENWSDKINLQATQSFRDLRLQSN